MDQSGIVPFILAAFVYIATFCYVCAKSLWDRGGGFRLLALSCFGVITVLEVLPVFIQSASGEGFPMFIVAWGIGSYLLLMVSLTVKIVLGIHGFLCRLEGNR